jgi:hypothetical protein
MVGRPPIYSDDDAPLFDAKVDQYFDQQQATGRPPTIAGLALFLGFSDRQTFTEYGKREAFSLTVSRAKTMIEVDRSERLVLKDEYTPGLPMDLANNHGWVTGKNELTGKDGGPIQQKALHTVQWTTVPKPAPAK